MFWSSINFVVIYWANGNFVIFQFNILHYHPALRQATQRSAVFHLSFLDVTDLLWDGNKIIYRYDNPIVCLISSCDSTLCFEAKSRITGASSIASKSYWKSHASVSDGSRLFLIKIYRELKSTAPRLVQKLFRSFRIMLIDARDIHLEVDGQNKYLEINF